MKWCTLDCLCCTWPVVEGHGKNPGCLLNRAVVLLLKPRRRPHDVLSIHGGGPQIRLAPPEVHNRLLCLGGVEDQVVVSTPLHQPLKPPPPTEVVSPARLDDDAVVQLVLLTRSFYVFTTVNETKLDFNFHVINAAACTTPRS